MFNNNNMYSYISLCKVPITPVHQITFKSKAEQYKYFKEHTVFTADKCKYTPRSGVIRVKGYVDDLNTCNYGFYSNKYKDTTKNYFFFIAEKNAISREVTELTIQIDVIQTWFFDWQLNPCFIERCHVLNDQIGVHTFPESFELGEYVSHDKIEPECLKQKPAFYLATTDDSMGGIFGATFSGFKITEYAYEDTHMLKDKIQSLCDDGKADSIAFIFTFPSGLLNGVTSGVSIVGREGTLSKTTTLAFKDLCKNFEYHGQSHTPYNNKLYVYPFNFFTIKSGNSNIVLKFEDFQDLNNMQFKIESVLCQNPTITLTPLNYCNKQFAIDDSISMNLYGLCSWNNDNYANWFAQHKNSITAQSDNARASFKVSSEVNGRNFNNAMDNINYTFNKGMLNSGITAMQQLGSLNFIGAGTTLGTAAINNGMDRTQNTKNAINDLNNKQLLNNNNFQAQMRSIMASVQDASVQPNTARGDTSSCGLDIARNTATFIIEHTMIKPEYARMIDMYFQCYGYQVNTIEYPNIYTRTKWNYIKTLNCSCNGDIPYADIQEIESIFNNGLTFWHDEKYMFNYDQINNIITQ